MMWIVWIMFLVGAAITAVRFSSTVLFNFKLNVGFLAHLEEHVVVPWWVQGVPHYCGHQSVLVDMLDFGDVRAYSQCGQLLPKQGHLHQQPTCGR